MITLYVQNNFPVFQNKVYDTFEEAVDCTKGDIKLVEDEISGLVYNAAFQPELMNYDNNYNNEQSNSPFFQGHLNDVIDIIEKLIGKEKLVEVGCGKGFFLELLLEQGFDVTGFDPTYEGNNPRVHRKYFEPGLIDNSNGLILRHVLEHIPNPYDFLVQLAEANGYEGKIYIEVPCFDWICENRVWFDIFYEHVNYFRLTDFDRIFGKVIESGRIFGGQYLYVVAELSSIRKPVMDRNDRVVFPDDFLRGIISGSPKGSETVIWGGASKGVIFSLLKIRAGYSVDIVIDINHAKQGKYLAASGIRISSPELALCQLPKTSTIHVMNSNYLPEIIEMSNNNFTYKTYGQK